MNRFVEFDLAVFLAFDGMVRIDINSTLLINLSAIFHGTIDLISKDIDW